MQTYIYMSRKIIDNINCIIYESNIAIMLIIQYLFDGIRKMEIDLQLRKACISS